MAFSNPTTSRLLTGRLALITGAGQGNGRALAIGLAQAGARVIVTDVNALSVAETERMVRDQGGEAWSFELDITSAEACGALSARVATEIGKVDLLVNNAGINIREGSSSPNAASNWRRTIEVNVNGTFNVTHAWLPAIKETKGTIVNIASTASFSSVPHLGYAPSKGAIKMFTQALAAELAPLGVRVNALAPGLIETPMTAVILEDPERLKAYLSRVPMGRAGLPEDLVGPVVFLASDLSRYVTGVTLPVDGGFLAI